MMKKAPPAPAPANSPELGPPQAKLLSFSDHIRELRRRVLWTGLMFVAASSVAYQFHEPLVHLVMQPLGGQKLIYLTPGGGFSFIFQITLYAGLIVAAPMLMYQLYGFVQPALPARARRSAGRVVGLALLLMLAGVLYGYFIAVPAALHFLSTFAGSQVLPNLTADSYLSFFLSYVAGLGLLFQLPLLLMFWHWIHPLTPSGLLKSERWIILFAFVAAALITPTPDVINQMMIAVPLLTIYQFGVVAVLIAISRAKRLAAAPVAAKARPIQAVQTIPATARPRPVTPAAVAPAAQLAPPSAPFARSLPNRARYVDGVMRRSFVTRRSAAARPGPVQPRPQTRHAANPITLKPELYRRQTLSIDGISQI